MALRDEMAFPASVIGPVCPLEGLGAGILELLVDLLDDLFMMCFSGHESEFYCCTLLVMRRKR